MSESDQTTVEQTLRIRARPETVWTFWTDPERLVEWWGDTADLDPQPGGLCRVAMGGGPVMRGAFVELVPYERIVFTFGWEVTDGAPEIPPGSTRVEVTLEPEDGDTVLTLVHTGLPSRYAGEHEAGWGQFLPLLVTAAEAGRP